MSKQLGGPMAEAGKKAGNQLGQGIASGVEQSKAAVEKATTAVTAARAKEADAAGKVRVAEAQLQALRSKGVTDAGRLAAAEERVNAAKRNAEIRSNAAATADRNLARAKEQASTAARGGTQSMQAFGDAAEKSSSRMSLMKSAGPLAAAGIAAIGTAAVAAVKFVADIGESFEQMRSKIQLSTGASGQTLDKLNESVKNVAKGSPAAIGTIAERMSVLYQRTGLTGKELETLTKQVNKAGAALGQDLDIKTLTGTMATFGVQGKDMSSVLDDIFRVSRNTGMGMNEIVSAAKSAAPSLQEFGFNLSDSAALIGSLDKAGVDANSVLATFGKGLVNVAKAGQSPKQAFADVTKEIQGFIKQGNTAGAVNVASKIFGTRGAVQFVNAVKSGAVSMDQLTNSAAKQGDSILDAKGATVTWAKTWGLFKNNVIIALEPLATRFFDVFIKGMTWLRENGVVAIRAVADVFTPVFDAVSPLAERIFPLLGTVVGVVANVLAGLVRTLASVLDFISRNRDIFLAVAGVITALFLPALVTMGVTLAANAASIAAIGIGLRAYLVWTKAVQIATRAWAAVQWVLNAALTANPIGIVIAALVALGAAVFIAYKKSETFRNIVQGAWNGIKTAASAAWNGVIKPVMDALVAAFKWVWQAIQPAIDFVKRFWQYLIFGLGPIGLIVGAVIQLVKHWETVKSVFSAVWGVIKPILSGFLTAIKMVGAVVGTIILGTVIIAWNALKAAIGLAWAIIQPIFGAFVAFTRVLGAAVMWLWTNAISPAWNLIKTGAQLMWAGIQAVFGFFMAGLQVAGTVLAAIANATIIPIWNAIKAAAQ
ncbi:phage tail tape measure protein, partial [Gordonia sp. 852002-10350_SCH5691597]